MNADSEWSTALESISSLGGMVNLQTSLSLIGWIEPMIVDKVKQFANPTSW